MDTATDTTRKFCEMLRGSERVVFFGGAGVSTESGILDFRSEGGIFKALRAYGEAPEVLLSHSFFTAHPETFYRYYKENLLVTDALPNRAHIALARLEECKKLTSVITQNIDGLHQKAGSKNVLELHGSIYRNHCMKCGKEYPVSTVQNAPGVPRCGCGGIIKPDVTLYEEMLPDGVFEAAVREVECADMLIVGGTSLVVYPAAGLVRYYRGHKLVLINKGTTEYDGRADLMLHTPIGEFLGSALLNDDNTLKELL